MTYQKSESHLQNLKIARSKSINLKENCNHCKKEISKAGLIQHEKNCYLNPKNKRLCEICQEPIKNWRSSKTCGYSCANKKFKTGPNHGNWKENTYRSTCFHYHDFQCVVCDEKNIVEVHHLDEDHSNNKPENLVPLCPTHHQYWHSRFKYLIEDKVINYITNWKSNQ